MIPKRAENLLAVLIFQLIYPAVLGTLLYALIDVSANGEDGNRYLRLIAAISVLTFYVIDYLFTFLHSEYTLKDLGLHLIVIGSMVMSVRMLGIGGLPITARAHFLFWLGITVAAFVVWDAYHLLYDYLTHHNTNLLGASIGLRTVCVEVAMSVAFFVCAVLRSSLLISTIVSCASAAVMVLLFVDWYRRVVLVPGSIVGRDRERAADSGT